MLHRGLHRPGGHTGFSAAGSRRPAAAARQQQQQQRCWRQLRTSAAPPAQPPSSSNPELDEVAAESLARIGWEAAPGLLPPMDAGAFGGHFERRARQRAQQQAGQQQAEQPPPPETQEQQEPQEQQHSSTQTAVAEPSSAATVAPPDSAYATATQPLEQLLPEQPQPQQPQLAEPQQPQQQPPPQQQQQPPQPLAEQPQQQQQPQQPPQQLAEQPQQPPQQPQPGVPASSRSSGNGSVVSTLTAFNPSDSVQRIAVRWLAEGGVPASDGSAYNRQSFVEKLAEKFIPLDLDFPGLRIINYDPAIFTIEGFMSPEECASWMAAAEASGCLQQSKIGGGNAATSVAAGSLNTYGARRTSSNLLLDPATQAKSPELKALMLDMQSRGCKLLAHLDGGRSWGPPGKMPAGGQFCYEHPQVTRYLSGQHFLAHEDGFPPLLAAANGFQRHATLLLYLNDVPQGGATHFDHLGISVRPRQGMALLFFPAYASGTPDARSLHTAQDAVDTKWVMQQWVSRGYPTPKAVLKAVKTAALAGPEPPRPPEPAVREVFRVAASKASDGYTDAAPRTGKRKKGGPKQGNKGFSRC